jgi:hypothetical protein
VLQKKPPFDKFVVAISMLKRPQNFKILVPTPHITPMIMWGTEKNLKLLSPFEQRHRKNKISNREFFCNILYITIFRRIFHENFI